MTGSTAQITAIARRGQAHAGRSQARAWPAWAVVAALALAAFTGTTWLARFAPSIEGVSPVIPLLWALPALAAWRFARAGLGRLERGTAFVPMALIAGGIQVAVLFVLGALFGYGWSPYDHDWQSLVVNTLWVGAILVCREIARAFIAGSLAGAGETRALMLTWPLLVLTSLSLNALTGLSGGMQTFDYIGRIVFPTAGMGLVATWLALRGGWLASAAYAVPLLAFEWYSPILPDLPWTVAAFVGVIVPLLLLGSLGAAREPGAEPAEDELIGPSPSTIGLLAFAVALLWFNTGVFGVTPALVYGHSMEPGMHTGDLAISERVEPQDIEIGDVIRFTQGTHDVLHRVIEIRQEPDGLYFITQGDNNPNPDPPVAAENVRGRQVLHVPKLGMPAVFIKEFLAGVRG